MAKESIAIYLGIILCSMVCLICLMCIVAFVGFGLSITTIVLFAGAGDGCPEYDTFNWIVFYSLIGFYVYGCCAGCAKVILISVFAPEKDDKMFVERLIDSFILLPTSYYGVFLGIYAWTIV